MNQEIKTRDQRFQLTLFLAFSTFHAVFCSAQSLFFFLGVVFYAFHSDVSSHLTLGLRCINVRPGTTSNGNHKPRTESTESERLSGID